MIKFPWSKEAIPESALPEGHKPEAVPVSHLSVVFRDRILTWTCKPSKRGDNAWWKFIRWFHGRPQSEGYVMQTEEGCEYFRREDIIRYSIRYETEPKK